VGRAPWVGYEAAVDQLFSFGSLPNFGRLVSVGYWNDILRTASWARFADRLHLLVGEPFTRHATGSVDSRLRNAIQDQRCIRHLTQSSSVSRAP